MSENPSEGEPPALPYRSQVARGAKWAAVDSWAQQLFQLVTFIAIARIAGPEVLGIMTMAMVFVIFIHAFLVDGFSDAIIQRLEIDREHLEAAFWVLAAIGLVASVVSFSGAELVAAVFSEPLLGEVIRWLSLTFVFVGATSLYRAKLRREFNFRALALRTLMVHGSSACTGIALALAGYGIWSLVVYQLALRTLDFVVLLVMCRWVPRPRLSRSHMRDIWSFGGNTVGSRIVDAITGQVDRALVGYFLDAATLGFYGLARRTLEAATNAITGVLNTVALPALSKLQSDRARLADALCAAIQISSLISFPVFAGLALVAPLLVLVVLGPDWREAGVILRIVSLTGLCFPITMFLMTGMRALGHANLVLRLATLSMFSRVLFALIGVQYGVIGAALALVAHTYGLLPLRIHIVSRMIGLKYRALGGALLSAAVATAVMAACVMAAEAAIGPRLDAWLRLAALVLVGMASYGAALLVADRRSLLRILQLARS